MSTKITQLGWLVSLVPRLLVAGSIPGGRFFFAWVCMALCGTWLGAIVRPFFRFFFAGALACGIFSIFHRLRARWTVLPRIVFAGACGTLGFDDAWDVTSFVFIRLAAEQEQAKRPHKWPHKKAMLCSTSTSLYWTMRTGSVSASLLVVLISKHVVFFFLLHSLFPVFLFDLHSTHTIAMLFFIGFDLNLPLNEYGAVDFDFVQNLAAGKIIVACTHLL